MSTDPDLGSDVQPGCLAPRQNYDLFGHEAAETDLATALASGRMHHAWLITGPRGVGKATFAWRAVRRVLGASAAPQFGALGASPADPVCQLIEANACADLLLLRRPWDDKRKRWRGEITVEESRKAPHFFEKSAHANGGWRVCLVDSVDEMNRNAVNALLKTLEEPPQRGVILLVAHSPGRLPATIRSRCRTLVLRPPEVEATAAWLVEQGAANDLPTAMAASRLAGGAPGRALALCASGGVELASQVDAIVARGAAASDSDVRALAERVSRKGSEGLRSVFYTALSNAIHAAARAQAENQVDPMPWLKAWREVNTLAGEADGLYLDPKQTALAALGYARDAARQQSV
ncbi:DNA polymerase III subunit delta' [uncultured Maricaulis sp.]|uniref:DNA polymerase III subunit delta' n=1 Tax=uncultured Maricaulis sp. TaxID=174710 RepID=UPI0030D7E0FD